MSARVVRTIVSVLMAAAASSTGGCNGARSAPDAPSTRNRSDRLASSSSGVACSVTDHRTDPILLPNGSAVTIDGSSIAASGGSLLIVGTPTHFWTPGSRKSGVPDTTVSGIGVVRTATGAIRVVPSPVAGLTALHPRAVSAGEGRWDVLFVTGMRAAGGALRFDSATIWHGRFDGERWRDVSKIAHAVSAILLPGMTSTLVAGDGALAFAYAFDRSVELASNAEGNQGLVLLHRRGGSWRSDSLLTWEAPRSVQLAFKEDASIEAAFAQGYFRANRVWPPALFVARHDTGWHDVRMAVDASPHEVSTPTLGTQGTKSVVSWRIVPLEGDTAILQYGITSGRDTLRPRGAVAVVGQLEWPPMVILDTTNVVWFTRSKSETALRVMLANSRGVREVAAIQVPLDNLTTVATRISDRQIVVLSGGLGHVPSDPAAASYLTTLTISCKD